MGESLADIIRAWERGNGPVYAVRKFAGDSWWRVDRDTWLYRPIDHRWPSNEANLRKGGRPG